jgi:threonine/homoserine/homoserine lactone efflux protein
MTSLPQFLTFLVTASIFAFIPGPAMLYAAAQTMARGRRSGLMASLGLHLGGYAHIIAAAFGLSVLLAAVPLLYTAVKLCGALYLVWLGISLFRSGSRETAPTGIDTSAGKQSFLQSVTVEMLNPKTAMFYLAFLPQFISPDAAIPVTAQFIILGTIVNLMFSAADLVAVILAGMVMARMRRSGSIQRWLQRIGGSILVALGVELAIQRG